jgi:hypothetical protein
MERAAERFGGGTRLQIAADLRPGASVESHSIGFATDVAIASSKHGG